MKPYLTVSDIAQITSKERSTVFRWIKAGKFGPVRKLGHEYQVPHESFERWWATNLQLLNQSDPGGP